MIIDQEITNEFQAASDFEPVLFNGHVVEAGGDLVRRRRFSEHLAPVRHPERVDRRVFVRDPGVQAEHLEAAENQVPGARPARRVLPGVHEAGQHKASSNVVCEEHQEQIVGGQLERVGQREKCRFDAQLRRSFEKQNKHDGYH